MDETQINELKQENKTLKSQLAELKDISSKVEKLKEDNERKERVIQSLQTEKKEFSTKLEELGVYKELGSKVIDDLKKKAPKALVDNLKDLAIDKQVKILQSAIVSNEPTKPVDSIVNNPVNFPEIKEPAQPKPSTSSLSEHFLTAKKALEEQKGRALTSYELATLSKQYIL